MDLGLLADIPLRSLTLFGGLRDRDLQQLKTMPNLETLSLAGSSSLSDAGLASLTAAGASKLPKLRDLNLSACAQLKQPNFAHFKALESLKLVACYGLGDGFLAHGLPAKLSHLELAECVGLTDSGLAQLGIKTPGLLHLDIGNTKIGPAGLLALPTGLKQLGLKASQQLQGSDFAAAWARLSQLRQLDLQLCWQLPAHALAALPYSLESLDLSGVSAVDDRVLLALSSRLTQLKQLNLAHCNRVTDDGLTALADQRSGSFGLTELIVQNSANFSLAVLARLTTQGITVQSIEPPGFRRPVFR